MCGEHKYMLFFFFNQKNPKSCRRALITNRSLILVVV